MFKSNRVRVWLVILLLAGTLLEQAARSDGKIAVPVPSGKTFLEPLKNLSPENRARFRNGIFGFKQVFIPAPSQFGINDGLGPPLQQSFLLQLPSGFYLSPRIALPVIGLGLLEAVPESAIRALVDPDDENRDGISGRVLNSSLSVQGPAAAAEEMDSMCREISIAHCTSTVRQAALQTSFEYSSSGFSRAPSRCI